MSEQTTTKQTASDTVTFEQKAMEEAWPAWKRNAVSAKIEKVAELPVQLAFPWGN